MALEVASLVFASLVVAYHSPLATASLEEASLVITSLVVASLAVTSLVEASLAVTSLEEASFVAIIRMAIELALVAKPLVEQPSIELVMGLDG